jgi:nickel superoxide dismutase
MKLRNLFSLETAYAHCDIPCGVYDPTSAKIAARGAVAMIDKILNPQKIDEKDANSVREFHNSMTRYVIVKEQQAEVCKKELLILWTDYFKPEHLEMFPDLHDIFWKAAKLCSDVKRTVNKEKGEELLNAVENISEMFERAEKASHK